MIYPCRIRAYRKAAALSQRDLGMLLGLSSQASVSQYESASRHPSASVLIGAELLFGIPARELFPKLYDEIEREVRFEAEKLERRIATSRRERRKPLRALLSRLIRPSLTI